MPLLAERLKRLRKARGYTQTDVGKALNITQQQVAKWEMANSDVSSETLTRLSRLLECTSDWLLGLVEAPNEHLTPRDLTTDEWRLVDLYRRGELAEVIRRLATQLTGTKPEESLKVDGEDESVVSRGKKAANS